MPPPPPRRKLSPAMADFMTPAERSERMSRIRARGNQSTELRMVAILRAHGLVGWRRHQKIPGTPDFVWRRERVALFVDGCFWHGCPRCYRKPASNEKFWAQKVARNRARDGRVARRLRREGWSVLRVWEHCLRDEEAVARRVARALERRQS